MSKLKSGARACPPHPVGPTASNVADQRDRGTKFRIERLIDLNLLLMILLVGVPVLLSCILPPVN